MELFGVQFAPINIPLRRRVQTVAAAVQFFTLAFGGVVCLILTAYLILFTRLWWIMLLYCIWALRYDCDTAEAEGRSSTWVRNWFWWQYVREYFQFKMVVADGVDLDPKRNYLFCAFPHGMISTGIFLGFGTDIGGCRQHFPHHNPTIVALAQHFQTPLFREYALALGGRSCTAKSIEFGLSKKTGGNIVVLIPGGAAEAYHCKPGLYRLLLRKRKGFIRLALKHGTPLVPVITFGETDLFTQIEGPYLRKLQEFLRKCIGMAPVLLVGRGFFQYNFGIVPNRKPLTTVVGRPVDVEKTVDPSEEQINQLHQQFTDKLVELFETQKHLYIPNSQDLHLEFD